MDTPDPAPPDAPAAPGEDNGPLCLRIIAIFAILAASLCGSLPPLFFDLNSGSRWQAVRILKAGSAGAILALALIHMAGDSFSDFGALPPDAATDQVLGYPWASLCILVAILTMAIIESTMLRYSVGHACGPSQAKDAKAERDVVEGASPKPPGDNTHTHACLEAARPSVLIYQEIELEKSSVEAKVARTIEPKAIVVAYMMELGCVFHSVIIGIDLGLGGNTTQIKTRIVVLCFHQLMEGLGLGVVVATAQFNLLKAISMSVFYSLTTPIGVIIGICTATTYDAGSITALGINGAFNGVSAGLLLYVGLVTLLMEEFSMAQLLLPKHDTTRCCMYLAMCAFAGILAAIGIWA